MSITDREYLKMQQAGILSTTGASTPRAEVNKAHTRTVHIHKTGTENAATNVAELPSIVANRQANVSAIKFLTGTNVANDSTDYSVLTVYQGTSQTVVGTYNTHTSAQGAITAKVPATFSLSSTAANLAIAAGGVMSYDLKKFGAGKVVDVGVIAVDLEEV